MCKYQWQLKNNYVQTTCLIAFLYIITIQEDVIYLTICKYQWQLKNNYI